MEKVTYQPSGTCSKLMEIEIGEDGRIENLTVTGGCNGNLKGIGSLVKGMRPEEVVSRLEGIKCGAKNTSCPDQLAKALRQYLSEQQ